MISFNIYKSYLQRSWPTFKEPEDTQYEEVGGLNIFDQVGQNNGNIEGNLDLPDCTSATLNDILDGGNRVTNVAYQSYDSDT